MTVGQALLESAIGTGRVTVELTFGVMAVGFAAHLARFGLLAKGDPSGARRSIPGFVLTLLLGAATPLSVWLRWGGFGASWPRGAVAACSAIGTVTLLAALMFLLLSGFVLGRAAHFLAKVEPGARLVRVGPFALVRHPIYFGLGLMFAGAAFAGLTWAAVACSVLWWPLAAHRARLEDEVLHAAFGEEFEAYARSVPALWPRSLPRA